MRRNIFLNATAVEGNTVTDPPAPPPAPTLTPAPPKAEPPPVTKTVLEGKTEREIFLEQEKARLESEKRALEVTVSERERDLQIERERLRLASEQKNTVKKEKRGRLGPIIVMEDDDEGEKTEGEK